MKKTLFFLFLFFLSQISIGQELNQQAANIANDEKTTHKTLDVYPTFPGCENETDKRAESYCLKNKIRDFIKENLKYPDAFIFNGERCEAEVKFIVEADGRITEPSIMSEKGVGTAQALIDVLEKMPPFNPGILDGNPVRSYQWLSYQIDEKGIVSLTDKVFKVVEDNPRFPGCEEFKDIAERKKCADEKMLDFIYTALKYPEEAKENGVEGMVVIKFIVERDGHLSNAEVVRDVGAGLGDEALRVVRGMPAWIPGKRRNNPVRVQYNLPIKFSLDN